MKTISTMAISLGLAAALLATKAFAHGDHDPDQGKQKPPPFAILQLDQVRDATARFRDVEKAEAAGYRDIGLFVPNMGWHYMKDALVDGRFDPTKPELLVYADAVRMNGMRISSSSCGRCTPGCSSSTRTACSTRSIREYRRAKPQS